MKKLFNTFLLGFFVLSSASLAVAEDDYSTVDAPYLNLTAEQGDQGDVHLTWNPASFEDFNSWRVIRSETNETPIYPEDGYIFYDMNPSTKAFIDVIAPEGDQYYRVCAITKNLTRYCSSTVTVDVHDGNSNYKTISSDNDLNLNGSMTEDGAYLTWTATDREDFVYYYMVKSKTNSYPLFPNDGYVFYSNYQSTNSFLDETSTEGEAYFRLYVITTDGGRYASRPVLVDFSEISEGTTLTSDNGNGEENGNQNQNQESESNEGEETQNQERNQELSTFQTKLKDIAQNRYQDSILYAEMNGYITGYDDETFRPSSNINRAEFAKILAYALFDSFVEDNCFTDVEASAWYAKGICTLKDKGVVIGYSTGDFGVSQNINTAEALKIIFLADGIEIPAAADGEEWYAPYWAYAVENSILPPSIYSPEQLITRDEMTYMIYKLGL